jgi:hypothetical protein
MKTAEYNDWKKMGDSLVAVKITVEGEHDPSKIVVAIESAMRVLST